MTKQQITTMLFLAFLAFVPKISNAGEDFTPRPLVEFTARGGLPNFYAKLKAGDEVKVAYLGGSITAQNGWRIFSREYFQKKFPDAKVKEINAAIGGTGSDLGVFRLQHDVLDRQPDLLFVEFAVNDDGARPAGIRSSMEGIVRQTWREVPNADICFVYTIKSSIMDTLEQGVMQRSASVMEEIADHYAIPSIHMGAEITQLVKDGKVIMQEKDAKPTQVSGEELNDESKLFRNESGKIPFSGDGVHPFPSTGHRLYMASLERSFNRMFDSYAVTAPAVVDLIEHKLIDPLVSDNLENARMLPLDMAKLEGFVKLGADERYQKQFSNRLGQVWRGEAGAKLRFSFVGTRVGIYDLIGPDGAIVSIKLDDQKEKTSRRMDAYGTYTRLAQFGVGGGLENTKHTVEITVTDEKFDKKAVLFERNREDFEKNPEKYADFVWNVGAIFIVGELITE